jgi:hypothetical protein
LAKADIALSFRNKLGQAFEVVEEDIVEDDQLRVIHVNQRILQKDLAAFKTALEETWRTTYRKLLETF